MKKMIRRFHILLVLLILPALFGCEKFVGFKYQADIQTQTVKISGRVTNTFTGKAVENARVKIGIQKTYTDSDGNYLIYYVLGTDEERNKPVPVTISAENYQTFTGQLTLLPTDTEFNTDLVYLAPIIEANAMFPWGSEGLVCQARVLDYQGSTDIDSVIATLYYNKNGEIHRRVLKIPMILVIRNSDLSASYQCNVLLNLANEWAFSKDYDILVKDKEGYTDKLSDVYNESKPDTALFPPTLYTPPVIQLFTLVPSTSFSFICQAQILDFQGTGDIQSVIASFFYSRSDEPTQQRLDVTMNFVSGVTPQIGQYQCTIPKDHGNGWFFNNTYQILVKDFEDNQTLVKATFNPKKAGGFIFPPEG
ncbi:MAG TPA: carboxypeptidase regulatory-like domain-containing protein [Caldithrix sp.]|nr:carboxypeptidase regulatory-like domain-containing protein [Caldithrix sp.]